MDAAAQRRSEHLIEDDYQDMQITPARREAVAGMLRYEFDRLLSTEANQLAQLTANGDPLEHEPDRLTQAHDADAVPLAVLSVNKTASAENSTK